MKGFAASVALSFVLILVLWLAGQAFGFHVSLLGSLGLTIGLTVLVNLILGVVGRRGRRGWQ
jgi:hypothetical protein